MSTVPIINVANTASGSASSAAPAVSAPSDRSFNHVLSREVSDRNNSDASANASPNVNGNGNASSNGNSTQAPTTSNSAPAKAKSTDDKSKQTANASTTPPNSDQSNAVGSNQILALVANVQQSDQSQAGNAAPPSDSTDQSSLTISAATGNVSRMTPNPPVNIKNFSVDDKRPSSADTATKTDGTAPPADVLQSALDTAGAIQSNDAKNNASNADTLQIPNSTASTKTSTGNSATSVDTSALTSSAKIVASSVNAESRPVGNMEEINAQSAGQVVAAAKNMQFAVAEMSADVKSVAAPVQSVPTPATGNVPQPVMFNAQIQSNDPGEKLTPQVGTPGWDQALGQKVVWMVAGGQQNASLTLNPPDLGPMQVVLSVNNSHATATFTAAQPEVRQALEAAMPKLREMLGNAGIQLGQTAVNAGNAQQQSAFGGQNSQNSASGANISGPADIQTTSAARGSTVSAGLGLVDTFA